MPSKMNVVLLCALAASAAASSMSIVSKSDPKYCLDLLGERTQPGTLIDTWECVAGLLGQQWFFDAGSWKIRSALASTATKCIDAGDSKSGTKLTLVECNENSTSQLFGWDVATGAIYAAPDKSALKQGNMCLEPAGTQLKGASVSLSACNATRAAQQWRAVVGPPPAPVTNKSFTISNSQSSQGKLCLDLKDNKADNGNLIDLVACKAGDKGQEWIFDQGSYRIASVLNPYKCIDAHDMKPGSLLTLWDCNGFPQQQWGYQALQSPGYIVGYIYLPQAPRGARECLTMNGASTFATSGDCIPWRLTQVQTTIVV